MARKQVLKDWLQVSSVRITRVRFVLLAVFVLVTLVSDAWNLIAPGVVLHRWTALAIFTIINTIIWYSSRNNVKSEFYYKALIYIQVIVDILAISLLIYSQRGIASQAVILYVLPLITVATILTRSAVFAAAALASSAYVLTVIRYQFLHPGESYKVELYAEAFFFSAVLFITAALLTILIRPKATPQ
jgi:hypothetical protein